VVADDHEYDYDDVDLAAGGILFPNLLLGIPR
jgi:hypothetical protein